ncbi:MAG: DUF4190 domain-containing protein [Opitutaceae bacterium]
MKNCFFRKHPLTPFAAFLLFVALSGQSEEIRYEPPEGLFGITLGEIFDSGGWEQTVVGHWSRGMPPGRDPRFSRYSVEADEDGRVVSVVGYTPDLPKMDACSIAESLGLEQKTTYGEPLIEPGIKDRCGGDLRLWKWDTGVILQASAGGRDDRWFAFLEIRDGNHGPSRRSLMERVTRSREMTFRSLAHGVRSPVVLLSVPILWCGFWFGIRQIRRGVERGVLSITEWREILKTAATGSLFAVGLIVWFFISLSAYGAFDVVFSLLILTAVGALLISAWGLWNLPRDGIFAPPDPGTPNGMPLAVASLILGLFSLLGGTILIFPPILAIQLGRLSKLRFQDSTEPAGKSMANLGIALGMCCLVAFFIPVVFALLGSLVETLDLV